MAVGKDRLLQEVMVAEDQEVAIAPSYNAI
jgi:hypothetical protein